MSTKSSKSAKPAVTAAVTKPLTKRQIDVIRREAFEQLSKKAEGEVHDAQRAVQKKANAARNAQISKIIRQKSFYPGLIKAADEATADGKVAADAVYRAVQKAFEDVNSAADRTEPCFPHLRYPETERIEVDAGGRYRDYFRCLQSRAEEYALMAKEISKLELQLALGGDAVAILNNLLARIAKL